MGGDERHEPEQHEHLPDGARVDRRRDAQAEHAGARSRGEPAARTSRSATSANAAAKSASLASWWKSRT